MTEPVRLAIVGGRRGKSFDLALNAFADKVALAAVCDLDEAVLEQWRQRRPAGLKTSTRYEDILADPAVDAVLLATPMQLHAAQAIAALEAGKGVLSEVIAALTLEECWQLVEAVERTGLTYMMAENYCYRRAAMMVRNMVEQGLFGELTFAEGAYIHDCRYLLYHPDKTRTWRGTFAGGQIGRSNGYPTHSLGPVSQWLGILRTDRFVRTTTFVTRDLARHEYAAALLGRDHPDAQPAAWAQAADSASTLIETEKGRVIALRYDSASGRPHNMVHYGLQGSRGAYVSERHAKEDPLVWIEGLSTGSAAPGAKDGPQWQSLWELADRFEHPRWKQFGEQARQAGHGGGDYFVIEDFVDAVRDRTRPPIDVYDAVTWSCITALSAINVQRAGQPLDVPDFTRGKRAGR